LKDIFAVQDDVSEAIASALLEKLTLKESSGSFLVISKRTTQVIDL
jgi:hypothetical protein